AQLGPLRVPGPLSSWPGAVQAVIPAGGRRPLGRGGAVERIWHHGGVSSLDGAASADGRAALVGAAASAWAKQVVDLGGRNTLLFYKDLKVGTLDLTPSEMIDAEMVEALLDGRTVRLSQLAVRT